MKPLSFASLELRSNRKNSSPYLRQNETFKFVQLILSTTSSPIIHLHKCTHNLPPLPPPKSGSRSLHETTSRRLRMEGGNVCSRRNVHQFTDGWSADRRALTKKPDKAGIQSGKGGRGEARRGEWNEEEKGVEKGGKKKWRRVEWWRTIDFLIKGKLFQKVVLVGTKSASIPGIDTDGGKFGLVASALVGSLA